MKLLVLAKQRELERQGIRGLSDETVEKRLTRNEKARHCRRTTRSAASIVKNIEALLRAMDGPQGTDFLGQPLFVKERVWQKWFQAKEHVTCILDPPQVQLYMKTGTSIRGGVELPILRCARGSTSLESFHLHVHRFIPGIFQPVVHIYSTLLNEIRNKMQLLIIKVTKKRGKSPFLSAFTQVIRSSFSLDGNDSYTHIQTKSTLQWLWL